MAIVTTDPPPYSPEDDKQLPVTPLLLPSSSTSPIRNRVNHLYITEANNSISGSWTVDLSLRIPPSLMPSLRAGERADNLHLLARNGSVTATIAVIGQPPEKQNARALLHVESHNSKVHVEIATGRTHRIRLLAKSRNSSVTVKIPRDFLGPVSFATRNGKMRFSDAVQEWAMQLGQDEQKGKAFIGDFSESGYGNETEGSGKNAKIIWDGDELDLASDNSDIRVLYNDE